MIIQLRQELRQNKSGLALVLAARKAQNIRKEGGCYFPLLFGKFRLSIYFGIAQGTFVTIHTKNRGSAVQYNLFGILRSTLLHNNKLLFKKLASKYWPIIKSQSILSPRPDSIQDAWLPLGIFRIIILFKMHFRNQAGTAQVGAARTAQHIWGGYHENLWYLVLEKIVLRWLFWVSWFLYSCK